MPLGSFRLNSISRAIQQAAVEGWTLSTVTTKTQFFSVSSQDLVPEDIVFSSDGTKFYIIGGTSRIIFQYSMTTAWDISTASYANISFSVSTQVTTARSIAFKDDGTKLFVLDSGTDVVFEYTLSTAWNVGTASYTNRSRSVNAEIDARALAFSSDGTKLYVAGPVQQRIYQYDVSPAWTMSTVSNSGISFSVAAEDGSPAGFYFKSDGTELYMIGQGNRFVYRYLLTTAWNISTANFNSSFRVNQHEQTTTGVFFRPDGTRMYVVGIANDAVIQYNLNTAWSFADSSQLDYFFVGNQDATAGALYIRPDGTKFYTLGANNDRIYQYSMSTPWSIVTSSYDGVSLLISGSDTTPTGLFFRPDGTRFYVIGTANDRINQTNLSTAWDLSTGSSGGQLVISGQDGNPQGIYFRPDGLKMYMIGTTNSRIYQYTLSTAWTVSTATYDNVFFAVSGQDLFFKPDGTKLFVVNGTTDRVRSHTLSTAWNVGTAVYDNIEYNIIRQEPTATGISFKDDGTKMYIIGSFADTVSEYNLT
jgi:sugar lactone lactonase YvrE